MDKPGELLSFYNLTMVTGCVEKKSEITNKEQSQEKYFFL